MKFVSMLPKFILHKAVIYNTLHLMYRLYLEVSKRNNLAINKLTRQK